MKTKLLRVLAVGGIAAAAIVPATAAGAVYGQPGGNSGGSGDPGSSASGNSGGSGTLPFTGGDVVGISLLGAGLAAGGTVLVRMNRRRAAAY